MSFGSLVNTVPAFQTPARARQANYISGAMLSTVAATSLVSTVMICLHIYSSTTHDRRSRKRYKHIIDAMVQSSAVYTTVAIATMIVVLLNTGAAETSIAVIALVDWMSALMMITRVCFLQNTIDLLM